MDYLVLRLLSSFLVGCLLSQTGSLIQLSTKNILASPSTLGLDGLAVLWFLVFHSLMLFLNIDYGASALIIFLGLPFFVFIGFAFAHFLEGKSKLERIILLGITFNLFVGAIFSLWQFFFLAFNLPFPIELWYGHFRYANSDKFSYLLAAELLLSLGMYFFLSDLRLFSLGESIAKNWSLKEKKLYRFIFVAVALGTFVVVNLHGAFAFLGLVYPIVARRVWFKARDLEGELFFGGWMNGLTLMILDALCYYFPIYGAEVPVGLIVTGIGAVSLILLLWSTHKDSERLAKPKK